MVLESILCILGHQASVAEVLLFVVLDLISQQSVKALDSRVVVSVVNEVDVTLPWGLTEVNRVWGVLPTIDVD